MASPSRATSFLMALLWPDTEVFGGNAQLTAKLLDIGRVQALSDAVSGHFQTGEIGRWAELVAYALDEFTESRPSPASDRL